VVTDSNTDQEVPLTRPTRRTAALAGLGLAGTAGAFALAFAAGPAFAQDPTPSPSASSSSSSSAKSDLETERAQRQDEFAAALATELGVDKAKVAAALDKIQTTQKSKNKADRIADLKARLDAAVKAGNLTADQEAAILKAAEAGVLPGGGPGGRHGGGHGWGGWGGGHR
jgi:hypothetical protein